MINELKAKIKDSWEVLNVWVKLRFVLINMAVFPFVCWSMAVSFWLFLPLFLVEIAVSLICLEILGGIAEDDLANEYSQKVEHLVGWSNWAALERGLREGKLIKLVDPTDEEENKTYAERLKKELV